MKKNIAASQPRQTTKQNQFQIEWISDGNKEKINKITQPITKTKCEFQILMLKHRKIDGKKNKQTTQWKRRRKVNF